MTVSGSDLELDFAGTSQQVACGINSVMKYTHAYATYPIKCALDPDSPRNEGSFQPITVKAPEGSILNPTHPAPVAARQLTGHLLYGVIYRCLARIAPDRVVAESGSTPTLRSVYGGVDRRGNRFNQALFAAGGLGASHRMDGYACTGFPSNTGVGSVEALESVSPLLVRRKELTPDSGGAGKFRGGLGQDVEIEVRSDHPVWLSVMSDRHKYPPRGILGGRDGSCTRIEFRDGTPAPSEGARGDAAGGAAQTALSGRRRVRRSGGARPGRDRGRYRQGVRLGGGGPVGLRLLTTARSKGAARRRGRRSSPQMRSTLID